MGRNGNKASVFNRMVRFINDNSDRVVDSNELLLGYGIGRNAVTSYLYKFIKLGYLRPLEGYLTKDPDAKFQVLKKFPDNYRSIDMEKERRLAQGLIP